MTAHGPRVVSGCNSRLHVLQIGIFDSIISLSSKFHAGRRLASRPVRHALDWNHRGVPPGRKPLPCFRCRSSCYRIRHPDEQTCRIREAEKLERITARNRRFLRWQFEETLHRHVPHSRHPHERGRRRRNRATLHPRQQAGWECRPPSQADRASGSAAGEARELFAERQRNRDALCRCEKPYQEHKSSSKFV